MATAPMDGETAVVTGAARGIGRQIARRLAADGAHVVVADINDGSETVSQIEDAGGTAEYREGDVTDEASMRSVYEGLDVDVLVNNAGYYAALERKRFDEIAVDEWDLVMEINTKGVFIASKEAIPRFNDGGSIVNISSGVVFKGTPGFTHYVASKSALLGMTRSMANELGEQSIRVNAVMPGLVATEASLADGTEKFEATKARQDIKRYVEPDDIADAVAFLSSPDSEIITGQILNVDGGEAYY